MTRKEVRSKLQQRVGKRVKYKYPNGHIKSGFLKDRVVVWNAHSSSGADYWNVIDLIEFPQEKRREWVRIGYYRRVGKQLGFAGQTTITAPVQNMKRLFMQAAKRKLWFRRIVLEAAVACGGNGAPASSTRSNHGRKSSR